MSTLPGNAAIDPHLVALMVPGLRGVDPQAKRWTREEYYHLGELGCFKDERVELIGGEILVMSPQSPEHFLAIERVCRCLEKVFGKQYWIRSQGPLTMGPLTMGPLTQGEFSEPEPDVSVVKGLPEEYADHPRTAYLVVEVSKTSLEFDKTSKQSLYASMRVPDYWVLDLENRQLLVHREPLTDDNALFGHRYQQVEAVAAERQVHPLEKPDATISVADMLPPRK
jgi:Uma2 family endonuclease